jgi:hypothetical protein
MRGAAAVVLLVSGLAGCREPARASEARPPAPTPAPARPAVDDAKLARKAADALAYARANKLGTEYAILIDMSLHSGVKRFFLWDFEKKNVAHAALVGHGCCNKPWSRTDSRELAGFSNVEGSHCSSLGKYKLGARLHSDWGIGIKYEMHGLEESNSNALSRFIVFHGWDVVPDEEVWPEGTPEGWGCPTVSNASMRLVDSILQTSKKPVLMWIYVD